MEPGDGFSTIYLVNQFWSGRKQGFTIIHGQTPSSTLDPLIPNLIHSM